MAARAQQQRLPATAAPRPAHEVLAWGRQILDPALRDAVGTLPPSVRRVAAFHFGWCDASGRARRGPGATTIHPTFALLSAEAAGNSATVALPAAVAVALMHGCVRLHDDVGDGAGAGGRPPAACSVFGIGPAILTGSALQALAYATLAGAGSARARDGLRLLSASVHDLVDGRMTRLALRARADVSLEECLRAARARTGALLGCACALGELLASGNELRTERMRAFGERLGLVAELVDDVFAIDAEAPGQADPTAWRSSLAVVAAINSGTLPGRRLAELCRRPEPPSAAELELAAELVCAAGARRWADDEASRQLAAARHALWGAGSQTNRRASGELDALAGLVGTRD